MRIARVLLLIALITGACVAPSNEVSPPPTVAASITASPAPTEPSMAAITTPPQSSIQPGGVPVNLSTTPLGDLRGGRVYAMKSYFASNTGLTRELWSATLGGPSTATLVARIGFPPEVTVLFGRPGMDLRHIFSPDGRRVVVVDGSYTMTTIDLATGRATSLGLVGYAPSWTRDGRWIVFTLLDETGRDYPYRLWAVPVDLSAPPRQLGVGLLTALAGGSRVVAHDQRAQAQVLLDVATGRETARLPAFAGSVAWRPSTPQFAYVQDQQQTPGGGRPDDTTGILLAADDLSGQRVLVKRTGDQYAVRFRELRWNPARDELLYAIEGTGQTSGIVDIATGAERSLPPNAQYLTWAQDGEHLVGLARGDPGPRPSGLPETLPYKRATVVVLARDGRVTRVTDISALEPFEVIEGVVTVGH